MTSHASDQALEDGLRAGRRAAFERLYGDYHGPIYNLCARVVGDREEAKDLTQEVFIKAFDQLSAPGAEPLKLRPWPYRVATNACFNHLRSRRRLDGGGDAGLESVTSGVDEFERAQTVALVERSLGEVNERYRTALILKDLHGLPSAEIAEVMAVSRPAADVLVHRARASFRSAFAKLGGTKAGAPASLGLVLAPLSVPAALHAIPPLPASLAPGAHPSGAHVPLGPVHHGVPLPDASSSAGPAGAGLLTKIGAALSTKIGITAAAATLAVGGGAAVYEARVHDAHPGAGTASRQASYSGDGLDASHEWSAHDARWAAASHLDRHGRHMSGHRGHWDAHTGSWSWDDSRHASDGGSSGGDDGTWQSHDGSPGSSTANDSGHSTWSPTHNGGWDTSGTHESDSGW